MNGISFQVSHLAERQHGVIAGWQLKGPARGIEVALRGLRRVFRGVCAVGDLDERGWFMAAALAMGPTGAVSHLSGLQVLGLRPFAPGDIHVSHTAGGNRAPREGLIPHRRIQMDVGTCQGIPVTSPTQSLKDAELEPHELYRALEEAEKHGYATSLPLNAMFELRKRVKGYTRSDAEARFLLLCHHHSLPLPLVNHHLNGFETDFHWPRERLVVEVDGWEFHKEREQFEEDRRRLLVHTAAGFTVLRPSAQHVKHQPELVLAAIRQTTGW